VEDSGIGIPSDALSKLGEEFFKAPKARHAEIPGTGLGLSIAKQFVEKFDGRLEIDSVEGGGATFRLYFPLSDDKI